MKGNKNNKEIIKILNNKALNNIDSKTEYPYIHDPREQIAENAGYIYATRVDQFYKSMVYTHTINTKVTNLFTTIRLIIAFENGVPFFVNHEEILDFEIFLNKNFSEITKFFMHNKNEKNCENLIMFQFEVCGYSPDKGEYKYLQSNIKQLINIDELLLLYMGYMDSLFIYDNYEFELQNLQLIIRHSNSLKLK